MCTVRYPWRDGTSPLVFDPLDFIAHLAALVPPPRANLCAPPRRLRAGRQTSFQNCWSDKPDARLSETHHAVRDNAESANSSLRPCLRMRYWGSLYGPTNSQSAGLEWVQPEWQSGALVYVLGFGVWVHGEYSLMYAWFCRAGESARVSFTNSTATSHPGLTAGYSARPSG